MRKYIILTITAVLLASCGIYKKYERPEGLPTDTTLYGANYATTDSTTIATMGWRELFTDPQLQKLIEKGLAQNTDLKAAELRIKEAEATLKTAKLAFLPSFNFAPSLGSSSFHFAGDNSYNGWGNFSQGWSYTVPITCSWEIDILARITNGKRQAQSLYAMSQDYRQAVQTGLVAGIATQYYTLLMLDEQLRIAEETRDKFEESVRVIRAMKSAGMANEVAAAQMEGAWYQVGAAVEDIKRSIIEVENSLCTTLGEIPHVIERGTMAAANFPEDLKTGVPCQLLANRPDVRAAEQKLTQAYYATNIAHASCYPSLTLGGSVGWTNTLTSAIVNPAGLLAAFSVSLFQPIFNAGANIGRYKIAKAQQEETLLSFQQTLLNAGAEVNNALTQYQTALAKEEWRTRQVQSLSTAVEKTELLMKHTSTTYLEVLTAQQSLLQAQTSQTQDHFEKVQAVINLYHALGGGVE